MRNCFVTILNILNAVVMVLKLLTVFALVLFVLVFYNFHIGFNYVYNVYIFHLGLNCDDICLFVSLCFFVRVQIGLWLYLFSYTAYLLLHLS